jgi:hypothetical protein
MIWLKKTKIYCHESNNPLPCLEWLNIEIILPVFKLLNFSKNVYNWQSYINCNASDEHLSTILYLKFMHTNTKKAITIWYFHLVKYITFQLKHETNNERCLLFGIGIFVKLLFNADIRKKYYSCRNYNKWTSLDLRINCHILLNVIFQSLNWHCLYL